MLNFMALNLSSFDEPTLELGSSSNMVRIRQFNGQHQYHWVYRKKVISIEPSGCEGPMCWCLKVVEGGVHTLGVIEEVSCTYNFTVRFCGEEHVLQENVLPCLALPHRVIIVGSDAFYSISFDCETLNRSDTFSKDYDVYKFFTNGRILDIRRNGCAFIFETGVVLIDGSLNIIKIDSFETLIRCVEIRESIAVLESLDSGKCINYDLSPVL